MADKRNSKRLKFPKSSRLSGKKQIENLFYSRSKIAGPGMFFIYRIIPENRALEQKILVSVPKKLFHHASDRNLIRRRIKEAYRLNRGKFEQELGHISFHAAFIYREKTVLPFIEIEKKIILTLQRFIERIEKRDLANN